MPTEYHVTHRTDSQINVRELLGKIYGLDNRQITDLLTELHGQTAPATAEFVSRTGYPFTLRHDGFQKFSVLEKIR